MDAAAGRDKSNLETKATKVKSNLDTALSKVAAIEQAPLPKIEVRRGGTRRLTLYDMEKMLSAIGIC